MIRIFIKIFSCMIITVISFQALADNTIRITVKTTDNTAAGIGYSVEGKTAGTIGKSYTGKGIKNKEYVFGYRKNSIRGANISCGSITLTKDSTVTLITKGDKCLVVLNE